MATLTASYVRASSQALLNPDAPEWDRPAETIELDPSPLETQPSDYVIVAWEGRDYGRVKQVRVRQLHNGQALFFLLEWDDPHKDTEITDIDTFTDAAAVIFPTRGDAPLLVMGSEDQPVNVWFWRADWEQPRSVGAVGHSTTVRYPGETLAAASVWRDGVWRVVIGRLFEVTQTSPEPTAEMPELAPGTSVKVSFGVWEGSTQERGGIKAISQVWHELNIEA